MRSPFIWVYDSPFNSISYFNLVMLTLVVFACLIATMYGIVKYRGAPSEVFKESLVFFLLGIPACLIPPAGLACWGYAFWIALTGK